MNLLEAAILGLVEGITEYLPVSSTGHLILTASLLGLDDTPERKTAVDAMMIVIQGGAILAVIGLYFGRVMRMLRGFAGRDAAGLRLFGNLVVAFLPAAVIGLLLNDLIEEQLFSVAPVLGALALGGIVMIVLDHLVIRPCAARAPDDDDSRDEIDSLTWQQALVIGLMQCLAVWPGASRSMVTIVGGVLVGLRPRAAAEFSFLLGLPTLGAACVYSLVRNISSDGPTMFETIGVMPVVVGCLVATVAAMLAVKWLVRFLTNHGLAPFGWYRIALAVVIGVLWWRGVVNLNGPAEAAPQPQRAGAPGTP